jgi:hypothetical protein
VFVIRVGTLVTRARHCVRILGELTSAVRFYFLSDYLVVCYEETKRELNRVLIHECRCDERLRTKLRDLHVSHKLGCTGPDFRIRGLRFLQFS